MRTSIVLIPIAVVLLNADPGRDEALAVLTTPVPQSVDTLRGRSRLRDLLRSIAADSLGRPKTQCPMPVVRPDPAAAESMPISRMMPPGRAVRTPLTLPEDPSSMPVIRSGCWNPLDQSTGVPDSAWMHGRAPH